MSRRVLIAGVAIVLVAAVAMWVYAHQASAAPQYRLASASLGTVTQTIPLSGNLSPVNQTDLDFQSAGRVQTVSVQVGQSVNAGDTLATLDQSSLNAAVATAQANLQSAQAKLSLDQQGATAQNLASAQGAVSTSTVALQNAQTSLNDTIASNQQALSSAQSTVSSDQATVSADQSLLNADESKLQADQKQQTTDCNANPSGQACQADQSQVNSDNAKVASDNRTLTSDQGLLNNAESSLAATQLKNQQSYDQGVASVNSATVALQNAQNSLHALEQGATPQQIQMDQASVSIAQVNLDTAQRALTQATLTAPVAGVVTAVNISAGQSVSGSGGSSSASSSGASSSAASGSSSSTSTHAVSLLTPGAFEVTGSVSDAQVGQIAVGQPARVVPAGSSEALNGKVTQVAPTATVTSGVATFPVTVTLDATDTTLHAGTSAAINVIVNQVVHALTVPSSAIRNTGGGTGVQVMENGQPVFRTISIGASDSSRTQVLSGLNDGDQVVIATVTRNVPTTTGGGLFGGGGARFGGGGGGGGGGRGGGGG